jgi:adenylate cyclase
MNHQTDDDGIGGIARWLIGEARLSLVPLELIDRFCRQLVEFGVPLWRLRAGQRLANPLASAWGVIWTRDGSDTHEYVVARTTLSTGAYYGSPFQHVIERRQSFRRRLLKLGSATIKCCTRWPRPAAPAIWPCRSSMATARSRA